MRSIAVTLAIVIAKSTYAFVSSFITSGITSLSHRSLRNSLRSRSHSQTFLDDSSRTRHDATEAEENISTLFDNGLIFSQNAVTANPSSQRVTLTRYLSGLVQDRPALRDMESLLLSIQMACKSISNLVNRNRVNELLNIPEGKLQRFDIGSIQSEKDMRRNSMKKLDQLSTIVLRNALRFTGKLQMVRPAKDIDEEGLEEGPGEHQPGVLIASGLDTRYVACFDPLDGSGNADAAICTGTVFGIFETDDHAEEDGIDDVVVGGGDGSSLESKRDDLMVRAVLQPGKSLRAAGYCLYSSATILVFSLGDGTHGFTLDPTINEFVMTHPNIRIPKRGNVYSCNEANSLGWSDDINQYIRALKTGENETKEKYALRYIGSMVGDIHRTLMYGGIFLYPSDTVGHPKGNLQLLYKSAPMSFLVEQAGGKSTNGNSELLDIRPKRVHERSPCFIGSPDDIEEMKKYIKHID